MEVKSNPISDESEEQDWIEDVGEESVEPVIVGSYDELGSIGEGHVQYEACNSIGGGGTGPDNCIFCSPSCTIPF